MIPLRILFITDRFPPAVGGVSVSAERLTRLLAGRGHLVHVLHLGAAEVEPGAVQSERQGALMVHRLGGVESDDLTGQLADHLIPHLHARVGFDLLHGHGIVPSGYLAAFYARLLGLKSVVGARGNDVERGMFRGDQLPQVLWALEHAGAVGAVSRELARKCGVLADRDDIHFTPNSVDTAVFRPGPKDIGLLRELGDPQGAILGFVGELRFKKGTHFLLDAFRVVREQMPATLLLIGGMRGEDKTLLRRFLRQYPALRPDIRTLDYVHDRAVLARYYNLLDLVLIPSLWDGMPNSVLEAMACARPVLATRTGGIQDVITHGETGLLIDLPDLPRLGEACLEVLAEGEEFRNELGKKARAYIEEQHTAEVEIGGWEEIYGGVMGNDLSSK